ncbi:M20 family metallopeptidase [Saccharolobus caldissimus]|uniref:Probable succinyl-diaminopimelate desuccinylase n=1 Tax=Saccharolobus caldissimus TaxID=1702097 RepID=A0AAQ4CWJ9_9CREN|nr:M20 family metallopeptidase [Saccharolobus caldissimus]BDC00181.1 succinyl-diaminopimelate desuccinylase [Saccharolobus caldissimus]
MKEIIELTSELVKIPSISGDNQNEITKFIKEWLERNAGVKPNIAELDKNWYTIIAEKGEGKNVIMLNGHYDVVPPGDKSKWNVDPFSGTIKDKMIIGRGSTDMKGGLAVLMKIFSEVEPKNYKLVFTAVPDEEIGGLHGSFILAQKYTPNLVIIGEPSGSTNITLAEKGLFQIKLKGYGKVAHGSLPSLGENAILKVFRDLQRISDSLNKFKIDLPSDLKDIIEDTKELYKFPEVFSISFNPSVIRGGVKTNVVPDYCELEIDMRVPPGVKISELLEFFKGVIMETKLEPIDLSEPNYTSPNNIYVRLFERSLIETLGIKPKKIMITGATDGRFFRYKNIPVIVYGPGELGVAHSYNEFVSFDELERSYKVLKNFFTQYDLGNT